MVKAIIIVFSAIFILSFQVLADNDSVEEVHSLNSDYEVIGETGFVEVAQQERELWYKVNLKKSYKNPVVIMKPLSYAGIDPVHIRLKGVGSNGFQFQLEEWDYTNNFHKKERVSYLVLESGKYILRDGRQIEAGSFLLQKTKIRTQVINNKVDLANWENISFDSNWKQKPIIFTQIQTNRDSTSVKTRNARVSASSFYTILEKQENWTKFHRAKEKIAYLAVDRGENSNLTGLNVTHEWYTLKLERPQTKSYIFLADLQTTEGPDPVFIRYRLTNDGQFQVFLHEGQSLDEETMHYEEEIGYLMFQQPGLIYGNNLSKDKKLINKEITEINTEKNKESLSSAEMASVIAGITLTKNGEIRLDYDIKIGRYEVTYKEYIGFLNAVEVTTERYNKGYYLGKEIVDLEDVDAIVVDGKQFYFVGSDKAPIEDCPVSYVSWYGAVAYANWLSEKEGLTPAYNLDNWQLKGAPESLEGYRLPTEVEWEYAARGGAGGKITDYAGSNNLDEVGWYNDNSNQRLHPVGQKMPNELGIYDLSGNVSEWTNDEAGGEVRIARGGNYGSTYPYCRVNRDSVGAAHAYFSSVSTGFRLVKTK